MSRFTLIYCAVFVGEMLASIQWAPWNLPPAGAVALIALAILFAFVVALWGSAHLDRRDARRRRREDRFIVGYHPNQRSHP